MAVRKIGVKWVVYRGDTDIMVSMHRCRAEAEAVDRVESAVKWTEPEPAPEIPEEEIIPVTEEVIPFADEADEKPADGFPCPHCDFVAKTLGGLNTHSRAKHPEAEE